MLRGRDAESAVIGKLLDDVRVGRSRVLVLRGEAGIGKTALLDEAVAAAGDMLVVRGAGIESEADLPYAGLHLLLRSAMHEVAELPGPQREAVETAFGLRADGRSDPFLVGLAVLTLMSVAAEQGPVLCVLDDVQWLDSASRDALLFAARRLEAESVGMLLAARDTGGTPPAAGLPELAVTGLPASAAAALLDEHGTTLSPTLRYRVLSEAGGNPLALRELPAALADTSATTGGTLPLTGRLQQAFLGQLHRLPPATRTVLLVAAAADSPELGPVLRAAAALGADATDLAPAERAGLLRALPDTVTFRHPLLRAAAYQQAPLADRLAAHRALADALDSPGDADRRAWQLAFAATGPDDTVATLLADAAAHARRRSGYAAAGAAYQRAAELTGDGRRAGRWLLRSAEALADAGEPERARESARRAGSLPAGPDDRARLDHVLGRIDFGRGAFDAAHRQLVDGARLAAPERATRMLIQAVHTAWYVGEAELADTVARLSALDRPTSGPAGALVGYVTAAMRSLLAPDAPAAPPFEAAVAEVRRGGADDPATLVQLCGVGLAVGHDHEAYRLADTTADELRRAGGIGLLPTVLFFRVEAQLFAGRHAEAAATAEEARDIAADIGQHQWVSQLSAALAVLAAIAGDEDAHRRHVDAALANAAGASMAPGRPWVDYAGGLLALGAGRPADALALLEPLVTGPLRYHLCAVRGTPDLVEAAVRAGEPERAREPLDRFARWARRSGQAAADALLTRCRALLADDPEASFATALAAHERDDRPFDRARTRLLHGEWLRRARRRVDARRQLTAAADTFGRLGARVWADRVAAELAAAGEPGATSPPPAPDDPLSVLTPQELRIVRLAAAGLSNRDIAGRLFLSPRTVGHHLYKAYPKLGVLARGDLHRFFADP